MAVAISTIASRASADSLRHRRVTSRRSGSRSRGPARTAPDSAPPRMRTSHFFGRDVGVSNPVLPTVDLIRVLQRGSPAVSRQLARKKKPQPGKPGPPPSRIQPGLARLGGERGPISMSRRVRGTLSAMPQRSACRHTRVVRAARGVDLAHLHCQTLKKGSGVHFCHGYRVWHGRCNSSSPVRGVLRAGRCQSAIPHPETCPMICVAVGITYEEVRPLGR